MAKARTKKSGNGTSSPLCFEGKLWLAANRMVDDSILGIERDYPQLKDMLSKNYARLALGEHLLGELNGFFGTTSLGKKGNRTKTFSIESTEYVLAQLVRFGCFVTGHPRKPVVQFVQCCVNMHGDEKCFECVCP